MSARGKRYKISILLLLISSLIVPIYFISPTSHIPKTEDSLYSAAQTQQTDQWIKNPTFESPIEPAWFWENGTQGDNSDVIATTSPGQANLKVIGEEETVTLMYGTPNSGSSPGWGIYNNSDFMLPDIAVINSSGASTFHDLDEATGPGQVHNFPSVHFKTNVSMPTDMTDYELTDISLEVIINASVNINVDSYNDWNQTNNTPYIDWDKFLIGDSANFYVELSDLNNSYPFRIASFETRSISLGQGDRVGFPVILTMADRELNYDDKQDLLSALTSVLETDHQNLTVTLGLDIYCEDNKAASGGDRDLWNYLIFKSCNLTVSYVKKVDQFTTISWNQIGNSLNGTFNQITDATLNFQYMVDQTWPSTAPLSELRVFINNKTIEEGIVKLSSANATLQDLKPGGIDVTSLISTDVNISISIQLFLKDNFNLDQNITISIDNAYLNITYITSFPDYETDLQVFIDDYDKTLDPYVKIASGNSLNVTVKYSETFSGFHIQNATLRLEGKVSGDLIEDPGLEQYTIPVNVSELGIGIRLLTIVAQKNNYESKDYQFLVEVVERDTEIQLFINGDQKIDNSSTNFETNQDINVTVFYKDFVTNSSLVGATVELLGMGELNFTIDYYNITINTGNLEFGINSLTIFAQLDNYQSKTIQFFIEVVEIYTNLQLLLNGVDRTLDPSIELPIGTTLNITSIYLTNQTGLPINNTVIQLIGEGISTTLTKHITLDQYSIILNSSNLGLDLKLFSIIAQASDYQLQSINLRVVVDRIGTIIATESGESVLEASSGDDVTLKIVLNNTDFGGLIKGASVTYRWNFGQDELIDPDNDGVYEVILTDVVPGTYSITILAYAGETFNFESYEITLSVIGTLGPDLTLLIIGLAAGALVLGIVILLYQTHFKFPPTVRKIRKLRKKIRKEKKVKPIQIKDRPSLVDDYIKKSNQILEVDNSSSDLQNSIDKGESTEQKIQKIEGDKS
ncbi:MAG: hypothetical protein ACW986_09015 [Promethearchaeota archaeon]